MISPFNFKWIIDLANIELTEDINEWRVDNFKRIYFTNGKINVGIKNNYHFFIDNKEFDFKIYGEFIPFQLKTNTCNFQTKEDKLESYTIGLKNKQEKYYFTIKRTNIFFTAEKDNQRKTLLLY